MCLERKYICTYASPVGPLTITGSGDAVTGLWVKAPGGFGEDFQKVKMEELPVFAQTSRWLDDYFKGQNPGPVPKLSFVGGSDFTRLVWSMLLEIPLTR